MSVASGIRELGHAARRLARAPGFTLAAVSTLGLAIGATTTIYALVDAIVLRPLPYAESDRLVWMDHGAHGLDVPHGMMMGQGLYIHYRNSLPSIESLGIYSMGTQNVTGGDGPAERVATTYATPSIATVLRVTPRLGRWFLEEEGVVRTAVAVLAEGFWRRRYGGDSSVIGRTIELNGEAHEVIGVMPASFAFPDPSTQIWAPLVIDTAAPRVYDFARGGIARLRDGVTLERLAGEMEAAIAGLPAAFPDNNDATRMVEGARVFATPRSYRDWLISPWFRRAMWVLSGAVGVVLLIACANVANLFLVRAEGRRLEMAVRRALGAGRARVAGSYLAEAMLLAALGGALGTALSTAGIHSLVANAPTQEVTHTLSFQIIPRLHEVGFDAHAIGFALLAALLAGVVFGTLPVAGAPGLSETVHDAGRWSTAGRGRLRTRNILVIAQVALAFVLLVTGGLMARTFIHLNRLDPGFRAENVLTFQVMLGNTYDRDGAATFHETLVERLEAMPGVTRASASTCIPLGGRCYLNSVMVDGRPLSEGVMPPVAFHRRVMPDYFETMGIRLISGRTIEDDDHRARTGAVVVSEEFARLYFPGEEAIGKRVSSFVNRAAPETPWYTVVGVVSDAPLESLMEEYTLPGIYLPVLDHAAMGPPPGTNLMTYVVRTAVAPLSLAPGIRSILTELDSNVSMASVQTMRQRLASTFADRSFAMVIVLIACVASLLLGAIGLYGVTAYMVSRRTHEIGIRLALGARPGDVARMVIRHGAFLAAIGLLLGLGAALGLVRIIESLLFGVESTDVLTYAIVALVLGAIALFACWLPARRAGAMSPLRALWSD